MAKRVCPTTVFLLLIVGFFSVASVLTGQETQENRKPVPADVLERFVAAFSPAPAAVKALAADGEAARLKDRTDEFWIPDPALKAGLRDRKKAMNPSLSVEALFLHPMDASVMSRPNFQLFLYNTLRSISTMKGIEYYSVSRKRMRVMFEDAYVIGSPSESARLPDPIVKAAPGEDRITVFQNDSSFGKNTYETVYKSDGRAITVTMKNLTTMFYGILPLVQPGDLFLQLTVLPGDGYLVFHGYIGVKTLSFFGLERNTYESFYNRIKALYGWFAKETAAAVP